MIGAAEHAQALRAALPQLRLERTESEGRFLTLDAEQTLAMFMVDGFPDPALFEQAVGAVVRTHLIETGVLSVYCELVAVLCKEGNLIGALKLEELWNELPIMARQFTRCQVGGVQPGERPRVAMTRSSIEVLAVGTLGRKGVRSSMVCASAGTASATFSAT